jgi:hypothetical protein
MSTLEELDRQRRRLAREREILAAMRLGSGPSGEKNPMLVNQQEKVTLLEKMVEVAEHNAFKLPKEV